MTGAFGSTLIALAPPGAANPAKASAVSEAEKTHYEFVKEVGTEKAWKVFLLQHPNGPYAGLAREQLERLAKIAVLPPAKPPGTTEPPRLGTSEGWG